MKVTEFAALAAGCAEFQPQERVLPTSDMLFGQAVEALAAGRDIDLPERFFASTYSTRQEIHAAAAFRAGLVKKHLQIYDDLKYQVEVELEVGGVQLTGVADWLSKDRAIELKTTQNFNGFELSWLVQLATYMRGAQKSEGVLIVSEATVTSPHTCLIDGNQALQLIRLGERALEARSLRPGTQCGRCTNFQCTFYGATQNAN